jgi:hypothetical protein
LVTLSEQVRLASVALGPLLRKRGTSPALGANLRRAVAALDRALAEDDEGATAAAASEAATELQACLPLILASRRPADHDQLDGIAIALSLLIAAEPLAVPAVQTAPPPADLSLPAAPEPTAPIPTAPATPALAEPAPATIPKLPFPTVRLRLGSLRENLRLLRVALTSPFATLRGLDGVLSKHARIAQAIRWASKKNLAAFRQASVSGENFEERLLAQLTLVHVGVPDGVDALLAGIEEAATRDGVLPPTADPLIRILQSADASEQLLGAFRKSASVRFRALLLPILAERDLLPAEELLDLLARGDLALVVPAARALAWSGRSRDASLLLGWALGATSLERANALLFAAVALGSEAALAEVRERIGRDQPGSAARHLVDALTIAGDASDADLLLSRAATSDEARVYALLAAANLGNSDTIREMAPLSDRVSGVAFAEALRLIQGVDRTTPDNPGMRLLRGQPWSIPGILACLASPDEPVQAQRRLALELRVRTGVTPQTTFPPLLSGAVRAELLADWSSAFTKASARFRPGGWYYRGRPAKRADEERG